MKKVTLLVLLSVITMTFVTAQSNKKKADPVGTWKFEAPYAPEGYTSGTIIVGMAEKKHTASMSFTGSEYKLPGENVKVEKDSVFFSIYIESEDIKVSLKIEEATRMTGKAVYSEGEVPLTLSKVVEAEGTK